MSLRNVTFNLCKCKSGPAYYHYRGFHLIFKVVMMFVYKPSFFKFITQWLHNNYFQTNSIFDLYEKHYDEIGFDKETGLFANKSIYELMINSNYDIRDIYSLDKGWLINPALHSTSKSISDSEINKVPNGNSSYSQLTVETQSGSNLPRSLESFPSSPDGSYSTCVDK